ncbi:MAG TPA: hypothetical protein VKA48_04125, partial [Gammaproteobacteria bacterium]|nr:hypothetical protein [Gammaproteobacteria bacterium]
MNHRKEPFRTLYGGAGLALAALLLTPWISAAKADDTNTKKPAPATASPSQTGPAPDQQDSRGTEDPSGDPEPAPSLRRSFPNTLPLPEG